MPNSQVTQVVKGILSGAKATFTDVFTALHQPGRVDDKLRAKRVVAKPVVVSPEQQKSLDALPEVLAGFNWPTDRQKLSAADRRRAIELLEHLRVSEGLNKAVRESLRTVVLNHGDVVLEETKVGLTTPVDETTPRDKDGHYLVGDEDGFSVDGLTAKINRSVTSPKASIGVESLQVAVGIETDPEFDPDTQITRKEFLELTRSVRVTDEATVLDFVRKHPERAVAIKNLATLSGGSLSMLEGKNSS